MDAQQVEALVAQRITQDRVANQAAMMAAVIQAMQANPPAPPAPVFALAPAANNTLIDYKSREGQKISEGATSPLKTLFALQPNHLHAFDSTVHDKGEMYGYNLADGILLVPAMVGRATTNICLGYARRTVEQVTKHAATYAFTPTRWAQDSVNLYQCLINWLTPEARATILQFHKEYTLMNTADQSQTQPGAVLL